MAKETQSPNTSTYNVIAPGTTIVGTITTNNDIRIDGTLDGDLLCKGKLVVGQQGKIKGNINCNTAEIVGNIDGKIEVSDLLSLKSTSKVLGNIKTKVLSIEPGAIFTGSCEMNTPHEKPAAK